LVHETSTFTSLHTLVAGTHIPLARPVSRDKVVGGVALLADGRKMLDALLSCHWIAVDAFTLILDAGGLDFVEAEGTRSTDDSTILDTTTASDWGAAWTLADVSLAGRFFPCFVHENTTDAGCTGLHAVLRTGLTAVSNTKPTLTDVLHALTLVRAGSKMKALIARLASLGLVDATLLVCETYAVVATTFVFRTGREGLVVSLITAVASCFTVHLAMKTGRPDPVLADTLVELTSSLTHHARLGVTPSWALCA
jgi:hypothetical protein